MAADDPFPIDRLLPSLASFDQSAIDYMVSKFESVELKEGEFFIKKGEVVTHVAFVDRGTLTRYDDHEKGHMIIDQFLVPNQFFSDRKGYLSHGPSVNFIQANSPCHLWIISLTSIDELKKSGKKYIDIIDSIFENTIDHEFDLKDMQMIKNPLKRILRFYDLYPHSWSDIPKKYLPCYLKMSKALFYRCQTKKFKKVYL